MPDMCLKGAALNTLFNSYCLMSLKSSQGLPMHSFQLLSGHSFLEVREMVAFESAHFKILLGPVVFTYCNKIKLARFHDPQYFRETIAPFEGSLK